MAKKKPQPKGRSLKANVLYRSTDGDTRMPEVAPYDPNRPSFDCYQPVEDIDTGITFIIDCWVCNDRGQIHPGYNVSPVPVHVGNIGDAVKGQRARGYRN